MAFVRNLLIFTLFCILQPSTVDSVELSAGEMIQRVKRQCGCCSCSGSGTSSCSCSPSCPCTSGAGYNNYAADYGYNLGGNSFGIPFGNSYIAAYGQYNPAMFGMNTGSSCGMGGTTTGCGSSNILPYNFGSGYDGIFANTGTGYGYPQMTACSAAFNTRCYCGTGYSPCNNGALCCRNGSNSPMMP
uniref:Uncharacterized protein n=1 Tax=Setaria digitata TaxID=48799 RepID=A0A915PMG2_9BILA